MIKALTLTILALIAVVALGVFFPTVLPIILSLVGVGIIATTLYFIFTPLN